MSLKQAVDQIGTKVYQRFSKHTENKVIKYIRQTTDKVAIHFTDNTHQKI